MRSVASGNYGSKFWQELALDYGLPLRSDLLSSLGVRSKHNRLLYAVGMLALACILVLAIWATGNSMRITDDADVRSIPFIRKFGPPTHDAGSAEDAEQQAIADQDVAIAEANGISSGSSTDDEAVVTDKQKSDEEEQQDHMEEEGAHEEQQQPIQRDDSKAADAAAASSSTNDSPADAGAAAGAKPAGPKTADGTSSSSDGIPVAVASKPADPAEAAVAATPAADPTKSKVEDATSNSTTGH